MNSKLRTDLALEAHELWRQSAENTTTLPGVCAKTYKRRGLELEAVDILDAQGEKELGMPRGRYVTLPLTSLARREEDAFERTTCVLAGELRALLGLPEGGGCPDACDAPAAKKALSPDDCVLVAGLGNRAITPDAIGPLALESTLITRHLRAELPQHFGFLRPVAGLCSGVLGTTGVESVDLIGSVTKLLHPAAVIAVDAIASRSSSHLCRTVQLSDAGIVPGSGVGNARKEMSEKTLGVPVVSIGVPTVVSAGTLVFDLTGGRVDPERLGEGRDMIVTSRDIDCGVRDCARLIGYAVNLALHDGLTVGDVDMLLS